MKWDYISDVGTCAYSKIGLAVATKSVPTTTTASISNRRATGEAKTGRSTFTMTRTWR